MEHELRTFNTMLMLKKQSLERYLRGRFGPKGTLLTYGAIGKGSSQSPYKQYGYGSPVKLTFQIEKRKWCQQTIPGADIIDRLQCSLAGSSLHVSPSFRRRTGYRFCSSCCVLSPHPPNISAI